MTYQTRATSLPKLLCKLLKNMKKNTSNATCSQQSKASIVMPFLATSFCLLVLTCFVQPLSAAEQLIEDIELRNLERLNADLVFDSLTIGIGDSFEQDRLSQAIRNLFETNYFDDIRAEREGNTLVFIFEERPTIRKVIIDEKIVIPEEKIKETLDAQLLSEGEILRRDTLSKIVGSLELAYSQNGQYGTSVRAETEEVGDKLVDINITVDEAPVASIAQINLIGNKAFDDERILEQFESSARTTWNSFWSGGKGGGASGYVKQRMEGDLGRLRDFYFEHGYINFEVKGVQVSISRDRRSIYVSITLHEGEKFTIDTIGFGGDLLIAESRYRDLLRFKTQDVYSESKVTASKLAMERMLGDLGYGFAEISIKFDKNQSNKSVSVRFFVNPGSRTYVRRIVFLGNTKTADEVLRRELRQFEGGWYSNSKIQESIIRLQRLGYFSAVSHRTLPVPNRPDQLDIEFTVQERPTGRFTGGLVYSDLSGLGFDLGIQESNVFGTGNSVGINANATKSRQMLALNWSRPYVTNDGVSLSSRVFYEKYDYTDTEIANFAISSYGGSIGLSYPVANNIRFGYGYSYTNRDIQLGSTPVVEVEDFTTEYGTSIDTLSYNLNLTHNALNKGILPTAGAYNKGSLRLYAGLSNSPGFYALNYENKYFFPLEVQHKWVSRTSVRLGYGRAYQVDRQFPFLFNFYAGGYGTVRGFSSGSLGPRSTYSGTGASGGAIGGNILLQGTQELIFPLWFNSDSVRTSLFYDIGNVFTTSCLADVKWCKEGVNKSELRSSYGVSLIWYTAVGPLVFSIPRAINAQAEDSPTSFEFKIGRIY